uniref:Uncharacterized protein n=1 Tax=Romanomermis culicivorax TaxID=13658 RepID=A0A915JG62_ROMCU
MQPSIDCAAVVSILYFVLKHFPQDFALYISVNANSSEKLHKQSGSKSGLANIDNCIQLDTRWFNVKTNFLERDGSTVQDWTDHYI